MHLTLRRRESWPESSDAASALQSGGKCLKLGRFSRLETFLGWPANMDSHVHLWSSENSEERPW